MQVANPILRSKVLDILPSETLAAAHTHTTHTHTHTHCP